MISNQAWADDESAPSVAAYDEHARARWVHEPPKRGGRTPFQRDRARVLHSAALRRLAAKTQVVGPLENDFPRTRLTHTLEVAQIGRELAGSLGCDPDVVEVACLAHDLGHPPFGHNGEDALDELAAACGGFEGNAQSLRVLTRLEAKTTTAEGRSVGLNLTRASLDAATKYPWTRADGNRKYGVYASDLAVFSWLREGAPGRRRCLEAQVMDWADDVAYSVHDVEDGIQAGHVDPGSLADRSVQEEVATLAVAHYAAEAEPSEVTEALQRLLAQPWWPAAYDGSFRAMAALKNLTSQLIGRFCLEVERATHTAAGRAAVARYDADLVVPRAIRRECDALKAVALHLVMRRAGYERRYAEQRAVLHELVEAARVGAPATLDPVFREGYLEAADDSARLRVVLDQVASLTDTSARTWHSRLVGNAT
ncbi:MAG: deoxyguanosinetriphosphate triphosphohydrolase [Candidatus Nanopelagicales bacterium]